PAWDHPRPWARRGQALGPRLPAARPRGVPRRPRGGAADLGPLPRGLAPLGRAALSAGVVNPTAGMAVSRGMARVLLSAFVIVLTLSLAPPPARAQGSGVERARALFV